MSQGSCQVAWPCIAGRIDTFLAVPAKFTSSYHRRKAESCVPFVRITTAIVIFPLTIQEDRPSHKYNVKSPKYLSGNSQTIF